MRKHGLRRTSSLLLMTGLGLIALLAVNTQAENLSTGGIPGKFKVLGSGTLASNVPFIGKSLVGKFLIGSKNAYIECTGSKLEEGSQFINENEALVVVLFEGCVVHKDKSPFTVLEVCDILGESKGGKAGNIEAVAIALPKLHEGKLFILFESTGGKPLATIKFEPECAIGLKIGGKAEVTGSVVAEVENGAEELFVRLLIFSEPIQKLFQNGGVDDKLLYGANEALMTGLGHVELTGTHTFRHWSVI